MPNSSIVYNVYIDLAELARADAENIQLCFEGLTMLQVASIDSQSAGAYITDEREDAEYNDYSFAEGEDE